MDVIHAAGAIAAGYALAIPAVTLPFVMDRVERRHLRWFMVMAVSLIAAALAITIAYDSPRLDVHDLSLRIQSIAIAGYVAALLSLYRDVFGLRPGWLDRTLLGALA